MVAGILLPHARLERLVHAIHVGGELDAAPCRAMDEPVDVRPERVAAYHARFLPALLDNWGLPADLLTILFGVGILQVLLTAPGGLAQQFPRDMKNLGRLIARTVRR